MNHPSLPLKAVLLDLDGTLHDKDITLRRFAALQYAEFDLHTRGFSRAAWERRFVAVNQMRIAKEDAFALLMGDFGFSAAFTVELREHMDQHLGAAAVPLTGARDLLADCHAAGLKLAVVTKGRDAFQRSKLAGMGLMPLLDAVLTSGGFGLKKPDARIFQAALDALGVAPQQAAMVGDDWDADMAPALAMGLRAVWKSDTLAPGLVFHSDSLDAIRRFLLSAA